MQTFVFSWCLLYIAAGCKILGNKLVTLGGPSANLKLLRGFCWNPSKQKDHLEKEKKERCSVIALEVIKELSAKEGQQEYVMLHYTIYGPTR